MSTMNRGGFYLIVFIIGGYYGILPLIGMDVWIRNEGWVILDTKQAFSNIAISILILFFIKTRKKILEYTICPTCKETYFYKDLEDGKCPKCKIETVDIDKFYDKKGER